MTIIQVSKDLFPFVHCPENCQREILDMLELSIDEKCHLKYWQGKGYTSLGKLKTFSSKCHKRIFCLIISQRRKHLLKHDYGNVCNLLLNIEWQKCKSLKELFCCIMFDLIFSAIWFQQCTLYLCKMFSFEKWKDLGWNDHLVFLLLYVPMGWSVGADVLSVLT